MSQPIEIALTERYNFITVLRESFRRDITLSLSIEMAVRIVLTVLQSIEIDFRTDITVSLHREIAL